MDSMENAFVIAAMVGGMHQMEIAVNTEKQLLIVSGLCCDASREYRKYIYIY